MPRQRCSVRDAPELVSRCADEDLSLFDQTTNRIGFQRRTCRVIRQLPQREGVVEKFVEAAIQDFVPGEVQPVLGDHLPVS